MDIKETAKEIQEKFKVYNMNLELADIEKRLNQLVLFRIPEKEIKTTVINALLKSTEINKQDFYKEQGAEDIKIVNIKEKEKWVSIRCKIVQLWEATADSVSQVGLCGDETGTIKFTKWEKAGLDSVAEGKSYLFKNVITAEYQGQFSISMNKSSSIEELKEDIEVGSTPIEFSGAVVDIHGGSGLIKRCPECNRALQKGQCGEHGKVEGIYDLRTKAVLDDGETTQEILLNREQTEKIAGFTLDQAKDMATEALDVAVVKEKIAELLGGRYFKVLGQKLNKFILVDKIEKEA
jgi:replication factor A1